jgi:hypothetical protein
VAVATEVNGVIQGESSSRGRQSVGFCLILFSITLLSTIRNIESCLVCTQNERP